MRSSLVNKISIISHGLRFDLDMFESSAERYYENTYGYCITNRGAQRRHRLPQVLLLGDELVVSVLRRDNSPWTLRYDGDELNLYYDGEWRQSVGLPEALPFFGKTLTDGVRTDDVISAYGAVTPGFFLYPDCHYFDKGAQCRFCSLRAARSTIAKPLVTDFPRRRIMEATRHIQNSGWHIPMITNTTGTPVDDEDIRHTILEPLKAIHDACDPKIKMHLLTHPPQDFSIIEEFKRVGVSSIAFNIEIYDRKLFSSICPGKDRLYGYDKWWDALAYARDVFGDYQVYCGIIWGLEPVESSMEGMEDILDRRIGLATNVFHADPGTAMARRPQPSVADITALAEYEGKLYRKYPDAGTIYDVSMRNTIDWEVHNGYLE
ncbi:radical SAM protein [Kibdelosporangium persicum]|uniref:Elp3 domain-containing protein n=1 Tax=Kibdelosporangium persicum TaxID=2698649 RepID=A0ABX2FGY0_9PSEU|nr:radical SAM protein [Kibdelosporangium persicum]NRN70646.1 Elp3 domain-containing protein [Kibdelosporangium persicum]